MLRLNVILIVLLVFVGEVSSAQADFFSWQSTNIQLLRGHNYAVDGSQKTIVTLEHANKWKYGDAYAWLD